jgi:ribosomal subunit interface protein
MATLPLQITFRQMDSSEAVESAIAKRAEKLDQHYERIMSCRVVVHAPHRHHHKGKLFAVAVDVKVPGGEIAVNRSQAEDHAHEDVYVAIRDAFDALERQLEDFARRQRGEVKSHQRRPRPAPEPEAG